MGQCKSKAGALDSNGLDIEGGGKRVTSRRKWRKRKGYSLSASLEADLNTRSSLEPVTVGGGRGPREGSGPVLVSYHVTSADTSDLPSTLSLETTPSHQQQRRSSLGVEAGGGYLSAVVTSDLAIAEESDTPELDNDDGEKENGYHEEKPGEGDGADIIDADGSQAEINNTCRLSERLKNAATPWITESPDNPLKDHHSSFSSDIRLSSPKPSSGVLQSSGEYTYIFSLFHSFIHTKRKTAWLFMQKYSIFKLENAQTDFCSG